MSSYDSDESDIELEEEIQEEEIEEEEIQEEEIEEEEIQEEVEEDSSKIPFNISKNNVVARYEKKKGKMLYVRFPTKLSEDQNELEKQLKSLCGTIIKVYRPRQSWATFCNVEFENEDDRNEGMKVLRKVELEEGKKLHVEIPRTESEEFVKKILEKKAKKRQEKRTKSKLKKLAKRETKVFSEIIIISNLPFTATQQDIKKFFPNATDIRFPLPRYADCPSRALVTLPTPRDATEAKSRQLEFEGNALRIMYSMAHLRKKKTNNSTKAEASDGKTEREPGNASPIKKNVTKAEKKTISCPAAPNDTESEDSEIVTNSNGLSNIKKGNRNVGANQKKAIKASKDGEKKFQQKRQATDDEKENGSPSNKKTKKTNIVDEAQTKVGNKKSKPIAKKKPNAKSVINKLSAQQGKKNNKTALPPKKTNALKKSAPKKKVAGGLPIGGN